MPHAALRIVPGVDQNKTPALNEAAISTSQLIRFIPDKNGIGLPQKLGGWTKFFPNTIGSTIRCLWAWADLNINNWLAVGAEESLNVINDGVLSDITPRTFTDNVSVLVSTVDGSDIVVIEDVGSEISSFDSVYIQTQISVGGLVLYGTYACTAIDVDNFSILSTDALGASLAATATVVDAGTIPVFDTIQDSAIVEVTMIGHGYSTGDSFPVLVSTSVGGLTIYGSYSVFVIDDDTFQIVASNQAASTASATVNGGDARYYFYVGYGPSLVGSGYGRGGYGMGGYGGSTTFVVGTPITADDWTLGNWGEILVANPLDGPIYAWNPSTRFDNASVITSGPAANYGMFVSMPQRQIVAWGSTFTGFIDPLLLRWCDIGNYDSWIATVTNQAGSYRIPRGSKIVSGLQGPQQGLIWTDVALWVMQYINQPYVYGFNEVGTGCGLIGRKAASVMGGITYWMSQSQFFQYADGVKPIPCPIWDVIFQDIDMDFADNIRIATNSRFGEVTWYYPITGSAGVPSKYVKYNVLLGVWDFGTLARTAWIDQSVFGAPIGASENQYIYQHETSPDADGSAMISNFTTGYFATNDADVKVFVDQVWPDMKWGYYGGAQNANVQITFNVTDFPGDTPTAYGPYTLTQGTKFITPRFRARLLSIEVGSSDPGSFWRLGNVRYRLQTDGKF